ncbi:MAG: OmpA family protein [Erythrobacter sp.]
MTMAKTASAAVMIAALAASAAPAGLAAQPVADDPSLLTTVYGALPELGEMIDGPTVEGTITARRGNQMQITGDDGTITTITLHPDTRFRTSGGLLGIGNKTLSVAAIQNGLPVRVSTQEWADTLVASDVRFSGSDLKMAEMIAAGTNQRFAEQGEAISANTAATEALRGRLGDIDKYNLKSTTNVYFDTGRATLTPAARADLCAAANAADRMDNSLMLVLGYTDSTGSQEVNQRLSERRAAAVVNHLQQVCRWKPYRMLTPTGMATADPAADNSTAAGRAQNRRVSVNVLVSKAVDGQ